MTMPSGAGALPGQMMDDPPPGYSAGTGSSIEGQKRHSGTSTNVFNHDPKMQHRDKHFDSKSKPPWLPPIRLGTSDPGVDVKDGRDLINGRGSKKAAAANKSFEKSPYKAHPAGRRPGGPGDTTPPLSGGATPDGRRTAAQQSQADAWGAAVSGSEGSDAQQAAAAADMGGNTSGVSDARDAQITGAAAPVNHPSDAADSHAKRRPLKQSQNPKNADLGPAAHPHNTNARLAHGIDFAESEAKSATQDWKRRCQEFTRKFFGIDSFQENTEGHNASAYNAWRENISGKHEGDRNPPAGVPVYWKGGHPHGGDPNGDGHAAISAGNGMIWSNDILRSGKIDKVPLSMIEDKWGYDYLGWGESMNGTKVYDPHGGDDTQDKGIDSSTSSGHRNSYHAPTASNMPTAGALPSGVGSGHDTHPWGIIPEGKKFSVGPRSSGSGRGYTKEQLAQIWIKAGGDPDIADQAAAVGYYESDGGNPYAKNVNAGGRGTDKGLWQINDKSWSDLSTYDVEANARSAVKINKTDNYRWRWWTNPVANAIEVAAGRPPKHFDPNYVAGKDWNSY